MSSLSTHVDFDMVPSELYPGWCWDASRPRFDLIECGIMYRGLELPVIVQMLNSADLLAEAWSGVGPLLAFKRTDGPWIPYDLGAWDQNFECMVMDRPWPLCLGDETWIVFRFQGMPCAAKLSRHENEHDLFCATPSTAISRVSEAVRRKLVEDLGPFYWRLKTSEVTSRMPGQSPQGWLTRRQRRRPR